MPLIQNKFIHYACFSLFTSVSSFLVFFLYTSLDASYLFLSHIGNIVFAKNGILCLI